jgi:hypothetical protein
MKCHPRSMTVRRRNIAPLTPTPRPRLIVPQSRKRRRTARRTRADAAHGASPRCVDTGLFGRLAVAAERGAEIASFTAPAVGYATWARTDPNALAEIDCSRFKSGTRNCLDLLLSATSSSPRRVTVS